MTKAWPIVLAGLGLCGCAVGLALAPVDLARAWLVATTTFVGLPIGAMVLLALYTLTGGRWGEGALPALRTIAATLPVMLLLFLPLLGAIPALMPFVSAPVDSLPERVALKIAYLAPGWMVLRTAIVMILWLAAGALLEVFPLRRLLSPKPAAIAALVLYALSLTVFSTDWMQALEREFSSTIYAMMLASTQVLGALVASVILLFAAGLLQRQPGGDAKSSLSDDLGKLLIAGILSFAYLAYMQWLIIWIGDLPTEAAWYLRRLAAPWPVAFWLMGLCYVALPFLALLLSRWRRRAERLVMIAAILFAGYLFEAIWRVAPAFPTEMPLLLLLLSAFAAVSGLFVLVLRWRLAAVAPMTAKARHVP